LLKFLWPVQIGVEESHVYPTLAQNCGRNHRLEGRVRLHLLDLFAVREEMVAMREQNGRHGGSLHGL
jgi:hypothetical protein